MDSNTQELVITKLEQGLPAITPAFGAALAEACAVCLADLGHAQGVELIRPGTTYLQNANLREWLVGQGQHKNFDRQDLRGVNLKGANLVDASFIGADLSEAHLQGADLSRAKLAQAQLDGTDFTGATLTGA